MYVDLDWLVAMQTAWVLNISKNDVRIYPPEWQVYVQEKFIAQG